MFVDLAIVLNDEGVCFQTQVGLVTQRPGLSKTGVENSQANGQMATSFV